MTDKVSVEKKTITDQSKYYIQDNTTDTIDKTNGLYNINLYSDCIDVGDNVDKFIRYNVINLLYFYFQLYSNDGTKPDDDSDIVMKKYKGLLKDITAPKLLTNSSKDSDEELKNLLVLDNPISKQKRIELFSGFNSMYPIISPSIVAIMKYYKLIEGDKLKNSQKIIETSIEAVSTFKMIGYYAPTVLIGFLLFLLQGNEQVRTLERTKPAKESSSIMSWFFYFLKRANLASNEAQYGYSNFSKMFDLGSSSDGRIIENTKLKNKVLEQIPEVTITLFSVCIVSILIAPYIFIYSKRNCSFWSENSKDWQKLLFIVFMVIVIILMIGVYIAFSLVFLIFYNVFKNICYTYYRGNTFIIATLLTLITMMILFCLVLAVLFAGSALFNTILGYIYGIAIHGLKIVPGEDNTSKLLRSINYLNIVDFLYKTYKIQFYSILVLVCTILFSMASNSFFGFFSLDFIANFLNDFLYYVVAFILILVIYVWYYLNINNDKNKLYNIVTLFLAVAAISVATYSIQSYTFVKKMFSGACDSSTDLDSPQEIIENKSPQQIFYETFIVPILPILIILIVCVLYAPDRWSFTFQLLFILVMALYATTSVYYPGTYGFIVSVFIVFLVIGKWSNIVGLLFGVFKKNSKNSSCK